MVRWLKSYDWTIDESDHVQGLKMIVMHRTASFKTIRDLDDLQPNYMRDVHVDTMNDWMTACEKQEKVVQ